MSTQPTSPAFAHRLALVLQTLRDVIAARAGRQRAAAPVILLLWPYLHRLAARFAALAQRGPAAAPPVAPPRRHRAVALRPVTPRLPRGFAWLIRLAPEAAPLGGQLRTWLNDPEVRALLDQTPQAGRLLRPLCRMVGIDPDPDLPPALFGPPETPSLRDPPPVPPEPPAARRSQRPILAAPSPRAWPPRRRPRAGPCAFSPMPA